MPDPAIDLASLFQSVTAALSSQKDSLNQADTYNQNHGDHMVDNFQVITAALEKMRGASPSEQLAYASQKLGQSSTSSSAQAYSQGLARAANQLQGQPALTADNAMSLVQSLLGASEAAQPATRGKSGGTPLGNLLAAGSAYMQAKQQGASALEAVMKAYLAGSTTNKPAHHSQSGQVVGGTLLESLSTLLGGQPARPEPKPRPASRPKPGSKPKAKPKAKPKPKTAAKTKPRTTSKTKPKPKTAAKPKPKTRSGSEP